MLTKNEVEFLMDREWPTSKLMKEEGISHLTRLRHFIAYLWLRNKTFTEIEQIREYCKYML